MSTEFEQHIHTVKFWNRERNEWSVFESYGHNYGKEAQDKAIQLSLLFMAVELHVTATSNQSDDESLYLYCEYRAGHLNKTTDMFKANQLRHSVPRPSTNPNYIPS